jgi:hypothetical protein
MSMRKREMRNQYDRATKLFSIFDADVKYFSGRVSIRFRLKSTLHFNPSIETLWYFCKKSKIHSRVNETSENLENSSIKSMKIRHKKSHFSEHFSKIMKNVLLLTAAVCSNFSRYESVRSAREKIGVSTSPKIGARLQHSTLRSQKNEEAMCQGRTLRKYSPAPHTGGPTCTDNIV